MPGDASENYLLSLDRELFAAASSEISKDFLLRSCYASLSPVRPCRRFIWG